MRVHNKKSKGAATDNTSENLWCFCPIEEDEADRLQFNANEKKQSIVRKVITRNGMASWLYFDSVEHDFACELASDRFRTGRGETINLVELDTFILSLGDVGDNKTNKRILLRWRNNALQAYKEKNNHALDGWICALDTAWTWLSQRKGETKKLLKDASDKGVNTKITNRGFNNSDEFNNYKRDCVEKISELHKNNPSRSFHDVTTTVAKANAAPNGKAYSARTMQNWAKQANAGW